MNKSEIIRGTVLVVAALIGLALWQNHTNSLNYKLRDCKEVANNNGYISFECPTKYGPSRVFVPDTEREKVRDLLSPRDTGNGSL